MQPFNETTQETIWMWNLKEAFKEAVKYEPNKAVEPNIPKLKIIQLCHLNTKSYTQHQITESLLRIWNCGHFSSFREGDTEEHSILKQQSQVLVFKVRQKY